MSLTRRLYLVGALFVLIVACLTLVANAGMAFLSGVRAYVGGEGLWSKAQKTAVYELTQYAMSRNERDWEQFLVALAVPLGDRRARLELEKASPDFETVFRGFSEGRNHPDDIGHMMTLFRRFRHVGFMANAIDIWAQADAQILDLRRLGDELHQEITSRGGRAEPVGLILREIETVDRRLTRLEEEFSRTLGGAARWITTLTLWISVVAAILVIATGVVLSVRILGRATRAFAAAEETARALRASDEQYRALVEGSFQGMYIHQEFVTQFANSAMARMFGYESAEELFGRDYRLLIAPHERPRIEAYYGARLRGEPVPSRYEAQGVRKDGTPISLELLVSLVSWKGTPAVQVTVLDVTERKRAEEAREQLEAQLRQAQKMEAVGQLAGGVAHDFNNLLTVITGRAQLARTRLPSESPLRRDLDLIQETARRAATLTQQLLAFSRKQVLQQRVLDPNRVVQGVEPLLRRVIGEDIDLVVAPGSGVGHVKADSGQLEQVILNLAVNARDAMPDGGRLTLETANVELDEVFALREPGARPGPHVVLSVSDTGIGMDEETQSRIFEPFFTTKEQGKGTGLGLSTVYGIVKQHEGYVSVESAPGRGATFRIYLPRVEGAVESAAPTAAASSPSGSETILLVEDEQGVRELTHEILEMAGYRIIDARHPGEALLVGERYSGPIHLLLTDVVMPQMNGVELAGRLRAMRPDIKVLFMSAHADALTRQASALDRRAQLLPKPFTPDALSAKVREVLTA